MNKNVILTGGSGFVGSNIITYFLKHSSYNLHIFVRKDSDLWRLKDVKNNVKLYFDQLENAERLKTTVRKINPYAILHLSAYGSYPFQQNLEQMVATNILSTYHLLESVHDIPYTHFLAIGSSSEYGIKKKPMKETDILEPNNYYAVMKSAQTHLCQAYSWRNNKPVTIMRLFNVYGPYEEKGRLVRSVIESALSGHDIKLATGKEARDFIHVYDVADLFLKILRQKKPNFGEIYNVGTGRESTIYQLAALVKDAAKSKSKILKNVYEGRAWDSTHWQADVKKTKKQFGWTAKTPLEKGIQQTISWYKKQI